MSSKTGWCLVVQYPLGMHHPTGASGDEYVFNAGSILRVLRWGEQEDEEVKGRRQGISEKVSKRVRRIDSFVSMVPYVTTATCVARAFASHSES